jgi:hypothetical protein
MGFECTTSLRAGLEQTIDWYRANRREARNVVAFGS